MRVHSASLVEQTLLVSQELIRVSILWTEMWHGGLEEASREYFGEKSIEGFFAVLEPLHQIMEKVSSRNLSLGTRNSPGDLLFASIRGQSTGGIGMVSKVQENGQYIRS